MEITNNKVGIFGPIYAQFKKQPKLAIKHLLKVQNGECPKALYREDIGFIDIVWGENDTKTNKGYGLKHIVEKHGKSRKKVVPLQINTERNIFMSKYRSLVLPFALVFGFIFHHFLAGFNFVVPYLIFAILLLNFVSVDIKKLRFGWLDVWLMLFQIVVSLGCYLLLKSFHVSDVVAEGVLVGILCPVAASVVVIACLLGANRETVTTYTIWGNMMVAVVAPIYFSFIGLQQDMPFLESFWMILKRISPVIVFPFFLALIMQHTMPKVNAFLDKYRGISFYLWACAFLLVMGKTFEFIAIHGKGNEKNIVVLGLVSILFCGIQFAIGKWLGGKFGDRVAGGQLLGQKNTAFGIWMANCYLNPLASVYVAFYAIWQNLFNSWQLWQHDRKLQQ